MRCRFQRDKNVLGGPLVAVFLSRSWSCDDKPIALRPDAPDLRARPALARVGRRQGRRRPGPDAVLVSQSAAGYRCARTDDLVRLTRLVFAGDARLRRLAAAGGADARPAPGGGAL